MLPPRSFLPPKAASTPLPESAAKSVTSSISIPSASARRKIAFASGCSLFASIAAAFFKRLSSDSPFNARISVTCGSPFVIVPVLSSATVVFFPVSSSETAVLNRIPFFAPTPFPTMIATGVARPSAHGQLITSTEIALASAYAKFCPKASHTISVIAEIAMTVGTKMPETLSATLAIGALVAAASLTMRIICERVVSSPTLDASQRIKPERLMVAAETRSPACLSTGMLSPVSADSSTAVIPSVIMPSTGMFSPGRTTKTSPFLTCAIGTVSSLPSFKMTAVSGASFIRLLSASVVLPFERASRVFPTVISVKIIAADSK